MTIKRMLSGVFGAGALLVAASAPASAEDYEYYDVYDYYEGGYDTAFSNDDWFYDYYEYADTFDGYYDYYGGYYDYEADAFDWEEDGLFD